MTIDTPVTERDAALRQIIDATTTAISEDTTNAAAQFTTTGAGGDGVRTEIRIGRHTVLVDEPPPLGGQDAAPNPVENALAGLLSCQVVTYRFWAAKLGIPLDNIRLDVEGDLDFRGFLGIDPAVRPGFGDVRIRVAIDGPAEPERYQELAAAVDEHCPVLDLFRNATPVARELVTSERSAATATAD